jgi:hypothetical protein
MLPEARSRQNYPNRKNGPNQKNETMSVHFLGLRLVQPYRPAVLGMQHSARLDLQKLVMRLTVAELAANNAETAVLKHIPPPCLGAIPDHARNHQKI